MAAVTRLWAAAAWLRGRWQERVLLEADAQGHWSRIEAGTEPPAGAERIEAPVLPPLVNAHSHAFQRAFVGLAERRESEHDDFWSWRDRMYGVALRIGPEQLRDVAAHLYAELLAGGYTQVCEFHYLQHDRDGARYPEPATMARALAEAAAEVGIGLTLLPVLYERAGFAQPALRDDQRRFATTVADVLALQRAGAAFGGLVNAGVAVHSLRAARPESIKALAESAEGPRHIHVAEQTAEVNDCLAATGCRPIEWLTRHAPLDARWQLVHATHATPAEIDAVAARGAGVVLCPATEANLGDGLADLPGWLAAGVPLTVGSDSQVVRAWPEELRWLEYGQRLQRQRRNIAIGPESPSVGETLLAGVAASAAQSTGFAQQDRVVLDAEAPILAGATAADVADRWVFSGNRPAVRSVEVAGREVVTEGRHIAREAIEARYRQAMARLLRA